MVANIKLITRYILIAFVMFLCYRITTVEHMLMLKDMNSNVLSVLTASVFGTLTLIVKYHFETKISNTTDITKEQHDV